MNSYWKDFYSHFDCKQPSSFAKFVNEHYLVEDDTLIDCGCGNGRDSLFFANQNCIVTGVDAHSNPPLPPYITFISGDFTNLTALKNYDVVYSRFSLHSITAEQQDRFLDWAAVVTNKYLMIECRTTKDELFNQGQVLPDNGRLTDHYRRFIDSNQLIQQLIDKQFDIVYFNQGYFSPFGGSNPHLLRIIGSKNV